MASSSRPPFDPVDTSFDPNEVSSRDDGAAAVVESPSLSNSNALARFEFENGRSKDGTKVLMVEWEDDATTRAISGDWEISWNDKRTVLPARDCGATATTTTASNQQGQTTGGGPANRLYFLLAPGINVPATVHLKKGSIVWKTSPLPAIFSPELGATARQAGKKGVLHTIWAKKRLQVLQGEIEAERRDNVEGVGLEMAIAEKQWIEQNFGVLARPSNISVPSSESIIGLGVPTTPASPRSPGGSRLTDKLNSLRISTNARDIAAGQQNVDATHSDDIHSLLSPETADVALRGYGSFAALKGPAPGSDGANLVQDHAPQNVGRIVAQRPPEAFAVQQRQQLGMGSLDAAFASTTPADGLGLPTSPDGGDNGNDDLFAVPMSPRNAETSQSPFSFSAQDTKAYTSGENAGKTR